MNNGVASAVLIGCIFSLCGFKVHSQMLQNGWSLVVSVVQMGDVENSCGTKSGPRTLTGDRCHPPPRHPPYFPMSLSELFLPLRRLPVSSALIFYFLRVFIPRCCQQTQRNRGRCTVQPRIVRGGVSAPWWRPSSPCVHEMPARNN